MKTIKRVNCKNLITVLGNLKKILREGKCFDIVDVKIANPKSIYYNNFNKV